MSDTQTSKSDVVEGPALLANEEFRRLADSLPQFVCYVDSQQRYRFNNSTYRDVLGQAPESLKGRHVRDVLGGPAYEAVRPNIERALEGSRLSCLEKAPMGGRDVYFDAHYSPDIGADGAVRGFFGVIGEVTASQESRQQLEDSLRQAHKLETVGVLASGIAHDLNNALTAVRTNADLAKEDLGPETDVRSRLEDIVSAAERCTDLVQRVLHFVRQRDVRHEPIEAAKAVAEACRLVAPSMPSNVRIERDIDPNSGVILAPPGAIHQTVMNLCMNGWQAMASNGGVLEIGLRRVELADGGVAGLASGEYAMLSICDTGPGVDPALDARIFEPFFTTRKDGGSVGLGLAVVKDIVSSCGGAIALNRSHEPGARFDVYFPAVSGS